MTETIINATSPLQKPEPIRRILYWGWRVLRRLLLTLLHLLILVFIVAFAGRLAIGGGIQSFPNSIPDAVDISIEFLRSLSAGDLSSVNELPTLLPRSLGLLIISLALGTGVGLILGGIAALKRGSRVSTFLMSVSVFVMSTPSYVAGMFLLWAAIWFNKSTGIRILPTYGFGWDEHLVIPGLVLAARPMASMMRLSYSALLDILRSDYVRTAHSKGVHPRGVFLRHVLRNAGVPLLTTAGVSFRFSLAVLPIVEYIITWPGIGLELLRSIQAGDLYRILVMVLPLAMLFILVNMILDIVYELIDPRLRKVEE
jgi:peptide/nickel transport system permease protein